MARRRFALHVLPLSDGGWVVTRAGSMRDIARTTSMAKAIERARQEVRWSADTQITVFGQDGRLHSTRRYVAGVELMSIELPTRPVAVCLHGLTSDEGCDVCECAPIATVDVRLVNDDDWIGSVGAERQLVTCPACGEQWKHPFGSLIQQPYRCTCGELVLVRRGIEIAVKAQDT